MKVLLSLSQAWDKFHDLTDPQKWAKANGFTLKDSFGRKVVKQASMTELTLVYAGSKRVGTLMRVSDHWEYVPASTEGLTAPSVQEQDRILDLLFKN